MDAQYNLDHKFTKFMDIGCGLAVSLMTENLPSLTTKTIRLTGTIRTKLFL